MGPALGVAALLFVLALALDHGLAWGLGRGTIEALGRVYFAGLVGAPLLLYPLAARAGAPPARRVALALLPAFLWWLTEVRMRMRGHALPEALWLAASPVNLAHLYLVLLMVAVADLAVRCVARLRGRRDAWPRRSRALVALAALALGPLLVIATVPGYLAGHHALFQGGLLPHASPPPNARESSSTRSVIGARRPPNIVFILSDDHRADFAGHAGHPFVETPALDRLAAEGVRFTRAYATSSLCSPSRASFLTGAYPHQHGVWNNFTPWSNENRTFFEDLAGAGYATAFIGKWHMPGQLPTLRGVDHFVTFTNVGGQGSYEWCPLVVDGREEPSRTRYIATELTDRALAWLGEQRERPFALLLSHKNVHSDFRPDVPERGRYEAAPLALPPEVQPWVHLTNGQYVHLTFTPLDTTIRRYAETVASLDREIGRVLDFLDAHGLAENTLVIYASDNGYLWGEHGLGDKRWAYEESIRIPFLVRAPRAAHAAGSTRDQLVANIDLAPTLLDFAGLAPPATMQGKSLLPLLSDPQASHRDALLYRYYFEAPYPTPTQRALVTAQHKYVEYEGFPPELFDLAADPGEQHNRAGADAALEAALAARLEALEAEALK